MKKARLSIPSGEVQRRPLALDGAADVASSTGESGTTGADATPSERKQWTAELAEFQQSLWIPDASDRAQEIYEQILRKRGLPTTFRELRAVKLRY